MAGLDFIHFIVFHHNISIWKNWLKSGSAYSLHKVKICFWLLLNMWWWVRLFELTGPCFFCSMNRAWDYEEEILSLLFCYYFCSTIYNSIIFISYTTLVNMKAMLKKGKNKTCEWNESIIVNNDLGTCTKLRESSYVALPV